MGPVSNREKSIDHKCAWSAWKISFGKRGAECFLHNTSGDGEGSGSLVGGRKGWRREGCGREGCVTDSHLWTLMFKSVPSCWPDFSGCPVSALVIGSHCLQQFHHKLLLHSFHPITDPQTLQCRAVNVQPRSKICPHTCQSLPSNPSRLQCPTMVLPGLQGQPLRTV